MGTVAHWPREALVLICYEHVQNGIIKATKQIKTQPFLPLCKRNQRTQTSHGIRSDIPLFQDCNMP